MKLVVGLGNPAKKYKSTKHNIGFLCLDYFAAQNNLKFKKERKFKGETAKTKDIILLKPQTFMNKSGESIRHIMNFYEIDVEDLLVIHDDLDLPFGKIRLREQGSSGGHNGIKSVISNIKTENFKRLRIGIDKNPLYDTKDYVLSSFSKEEKKLINPILEQIESIIVDFSSNVDFLQIMTKNN